MLRVRRTKMDHEETCSIKTLKQWARSGELLSTDLVLEDSEWVTAKQHPALSGVFAANIWDIPDDDSWSPTLPSAPSQLSHLPRETTSEPPKKLPKLPMSAIQPLEPSTSEDDIPADNPDSRTPKSIVEEYQRSKPNTSNSSFKTETVKYPELSVAEHLEREESPQLIQSNPNLNIHGAPKDRNEMWNPEMDLKDQPGLWADVAPPPKSTFSWFRLSLLVVPGAFAIFLARSFVISEAQTEFPLDTSNSENAPIPNDLVTDPLLELEDRLKSKLRRDTQMVSPEQSLSDALRVDLEYVGLDIVRLDSTILSWTGRKLDQPKSASIKIYLNPSENFEEDLLLASLVVAKYAVRFFLEMDSFDVFLKMDDVYIQKTIQTEQARFLLIQPGSLKSFLIDLSSNPK